MKRDALCTVYFTKKNLSEYNNQSRDFPHNFHNNIRILKLNNITRKEISRNLNY